MRTLRLALLSVLFVAMSPLASGVSADLAGVAGLPGLSHRLDSLGSAEAAFIRRTTIKQMPHVGTGRLSYRLVVVVADDTSNEVHRVDAVITPAGAGTGTGSEQVTTSALLRRIRPNGNKRYVFFDVPFTGDPVGQSFTVVSTMRDVAGGRVGQPKTSVVVVEDSGPAEVERLSIRQLDATNFEINVLVAGNNASEVASVDVLFAEPSGPAPIPSQLSVPATGRNGDLAYFITQTVTFEDPIGALDQVYDMIIELKDRAGQSLGSQEESVVVEGLAIGAPFPGVCWDGVQNGWETGVDCGGSCSPCLVQTTLTDSIDLLDELAMATTFEAARLVGLSVEEGTIGHEISGGGAIAWTAGTLEGSTLIVVDGFSTLTVTGGNVALSDGAIITMTHTELDDGAVAVTVSVYERNGALVASYGVDDVPVYVLRLVLNGGAVGGPTPTGVVLYGTAMYGDIILGGMKLDDFND